MKRLVIITKATGAVGHDWSGGDEQMLDLPAGRTAIDVTGSDASYVGQRWTGTAFEVVPPSPPVADEKEELLWRIETKLDELLTKP